MRKINGVVGLGGGDLKASKRITIYDLARELELSPATVSRALQDSSLIGPDTRLRVQAYARERGYRPNRLAQSLTTGRTRSLGLIMGDIVNPFFSEIVAAIQHITEREGYDLLLGNSREDPAREERAVLLFLEKQVDGIILVSPRSADKELVSWLGRVPLVLINRRVPGKIPSVSVDNARGAAMATAHLLANGRRHLLYLGGPSVSSANASREDGFRSALAQVPGAQAQFRGGLATADAARSLVSSIFGSHDRPDGIVAYDDLMAAGALQALHSLGLQVPDDVAVIGFDDCQIARLVSPALTTVAQPLESMAETAVDLVIHAISRQAEVREVTLEPQLVIRRSAPLTIL